MKGIVKRSPDGEEKENTKKRHIVHRIVTAVCIAMCLILIPIVALNLIIIIKGNINKDEVPNVFSISYMYVTTDSMSPEIEGGDLVFIKKIDPTAVVEDDVIAFFDPANAEKVIVAHRVKEVFTQDGSVYFRTKGDANNVYDTLAVPAENLVGKYVFRVRGMGKVAMFMQTAYGLIISIFVPLILLLSNELIYSFYEKKKKPTVED